MNIHTLTQFFQWCTIINGTVLLLWISVSLLAPDSVYRIQSKWYPIHRETFTVVFYSLIGMFKILFFVFNLVPYVALLIIGS